MCSWPAHLMEQLKRFFNSLQTFFILANAGKGQSERALGGNLGRQVGRSAHCGSDNPEHFDCFAGSIGMQRTQCFAPECPDLLLQIAATLGARQKLLRGLFQSAPVAAVELRPEANDLSTSPPQLVSSLQTKLLSLLNTPINNGPITSANTPQRV